MSSNFLHSYGDYAVRPPFVLSSVVFIDAVETGEAVENCEMKLSVEVSVEAVVLCIVDVADVLVVSCAVTT